MTDNTQAKSNVNGQQGKELIKSGGLQTKEYHVVIKKNEMGLYLVAKKAMFDMQLTLAQHRFEQIYFYVDFFQQIQCSTVNVFFLPYNFLNISSLA